MPLETTTDADLDWLFLKRLGRMTPQRLKEDLRQRGFSMETAHTLVWTDADGHRWTLLSRLGYLMIQDPGARRSTLLLEALLAPRADPFEGWKRATQPGEPDLLWAWLGAAFLTDPLQKGRNALTALDKAFSVGGPPPAGAGAPGDGGWVDQAFGLLDGVIAREGVPSGLGPVVAGWRRDNLLAISGLSAPAPRLWWHLGRPGAGAWPQGSAAPHDPDLQDEAPGQMPRFREVQHRRPAAMAAGFEAAWNRLMRWSILAAGAETEPGRRRLGVPMTPNDLPAFLGPESVALLEDYLRVVALGTPARPMERDLAEALALWVTFPEDRRGLSPEEAHRLATRVAREEAFTEVGAPKGTMVQWYRDVGMQAVKGWAETTLLDHALQAAPPRDLGRKPRF